MQFFSKVTCARICCLQESMEKFTEINTVQVRKFPDSSTFSSALSFKIAVVNLVMLALHGGSPKISLTVLLSER